MLDLSAYIGGASGRDEGDIFFWDSWQDNWLSLQDPDVNWVIPLGIRYLHSFTCG